MSQICHRQCYEFCIATYQVGSSSPMCQVTTKWPWAAGPELDQPNCLGARGEHHKVCIASWSYYAIVTLLTYISLSYYTHLALPTWLYQHGLTNFDRIVYLFASISCWLTKLLSLFLSNWIHLVLPSIASSTFWQREVWKEHYKGDKRELKDLTRLNKKNRTPSNKS